MLERDIRTAEKRITDHGTEYHETKAKTETSIATLLGLQGEQDAEIEVLKSQVRDHARRLERLEGPHRDGGGGPS